MSALSTHPSATDPVPATITVEEAARILGVSRSAAYRAVARGEIPTIRIGRRLLVPTARLHELLGITDDRAAVVGPVDGGETVAGAER